MSARARAQPHQAPMLFYRGRRIGIDPGSSTGRLAVVDESSVIDVRPLPRHDCGEFATRRFWELLELHPGVPVYCEQQQIHLGDREKLGSTMYTFIKHVGALEAALADSGRHVVYVHPHSWKSKVGLLSRRGLKIPKDASRDVAIAYLGSSAYPHVKTNTNAADACLVGWVGPMFDTEPPSDAAAKVNTGDPF